MKSGSQQKPPTSTLSTSLKNTNWILYNTSTPFISSQNLQEFKQEQQPKYTTDSNQEMKHLSVMHSNHLGNLQYTGLALPNFKNPKQETQLLKQSNYHQHLNTYNLNSLVEIRNTPLETTSWNNTMMKHSSNRSRVNQQITEEVTPDDLIPMVIEDEEVTTTTTDLALFGVEAVERGLNNHNKTVPMLLQQTTLPATTINNAGAQQILINNDKPNTTLPTICCNSTSTTIYIDSTSIKLL